MKKLEKENINTRQYWEKTYKGRDIDLVNTLRQDEYLKLIEDSYEVCELGCGLSSFAVKAARLGRKVTGLDLSGKTVDFLNSRYPEVNWVFGSALYTPFEDKQFDAVVAGELIEHMERPEELLNEMKRICKKGGLLIISTPILEFNDPEHLWEFTEQDVKDWGFTTYVIESEKFPGRSYIFGQCRI